MGAGAGRFAISTYAVLTPSSQRAYTQRSLTHPLLQGLSTLVYPAPLESSPLKQHTAGNTGHKQSFNFYIHIPSLTRLSGWPSLFTYAVNADIKGVPSEDW